MSAAEEAFAALAGDQRARLLRGVFAILEYDQDGEPGTEWSSDTSQDLGYLFDQFGIVFTGTEQDEIAGTRVVADGKRRTMVREYAHYVYAADHTVLAGPAVVFDADAARAWLSGQVAEGDSRGRIDYDIDAEGAFDPTVHSPADWVERMLRELLDERPAAPHVWRTAPGLAVEVVETVGAEGHADGGAVLVVEVGGLRVASRWLAWTDLAGPEHEDGVPSRSQLDAAVEALATVARTVNDLVEQQPWPLALRAKS